MIRWPAGERSMQPSLRPRACTGMRRTGGALALAVVLAAPATPAAATPATTSQRASVSPAAAPDGRWALLIALLVLVIGLPLLSWGMRWVWSLIQHRSNGKAKLWWGRSLIVGEDNRVSTSKTIPLVWTYTVAAALLSFLIVRWMGHPGAYSKLVHQGLNAQYALLIGGPLGAAILAKGIVSAQVSSGGTAKPPADNPAPAQLIQNDAGNADLGDLQYVLFNLVALVFFYGEMLRAPQNGMPAIPAVLLGLTSVGAVGYVGKKALTGPAVISEVIPREAEIGKTVKLVTSGIMKQGDDKSLVTAAFGSVKAQPKSSTTTTSQGILLEVDVPATATGKVDITVSVPNGKSATWPGFKVKPAIQAGQALSGNPDQTVTVVTSGVFGPDRNLLGVTVTIGGKPASITTDPNDGSGNTLLVTVPRDLPRGAKTIVVTTPGGSSDPAAFTVT